MSSDSRNHKGEVPRIREEGALAVVIRSRVSIGAKDVTVMNARYNVHQLTVFHIFSVLSFSDPYCDTKS